MVKYQWGIFWADLNPVKGSEQAGIRPVLVISAEEANEVLPVVTVMSLTSLKLGRRVYPIEAIISSEESGLARDSIAMAHQIRAISKHRLKEKIGVIHSENTRKSIKQAIKTYLNLDSMT